MCGRYHLSTSGETMVEVFDLEEAPELLERYNIGPAQKAPIIWQRDRRSVLFEAAWGLESGRGNASRSRLLINARSETVDKLPSFRDSFKERRCLVPATGFYEWERHAGQRVPHHLGLHSTPLFAMAGLWQRARSGDERFVILTTTPNARVASIHDRMPVILKQQDHAEWLNPEASDESLKQLLRPIGAGDMRVWPVSSWVNNIHHQGPRCLEEVAAAPRQQSLF